MSFDEPKYMARLYIPCCMGRQNAYYKPVGDDGDPIIKGSAVLRLSMEV